MAIALILAIALIYQLVVGGIRVEMANGRPTVDATGLIFWWNSATGTSKTLSTNSGNAETPAAGSSGAADANYTSAIAVLEQKGYSLHDKHSWGDGDTLHVLIGDLKVGAIGGHGERGFFFVKSDWVGYDSTSDSASITVVDHTNTAVTLAYDIYAPADPIARPSLPRAKVRFMWDSQHLSSLDSIPSEKWSAAQSRRGAPLQAGPGVRPIIFIPGIAGSYLEDANGIEVWPQLQQLANCYHTLTGPDVDCQSIALAPLRFTPNGSPPLGRGVDVADGMHRPVDPPLGDASPALGGVIGTAAYDYYAFSLFSVGKTNHLYDLTAENAAASGYVVSPTDDLTGLGSCRGKSRCFVPVGVDWRRSATENAARVLDVVENVLTITGADRVDILAHSQGGLIAAAVVREARSVGEVNRIVTLGTPFLGAPKLLYVVLYGGCFESGCHLAPRVLQQLAENYPGAAELTPSPAYYSATGRSGLILSGSTVGVPVELNETDARSQEAAVLAAPPLSRNMDLIHRADEFHATVDKWTSIDPQVGLLRMIGYDATDAETGCLAVPCADQQSIATPAGTIGDVYVDGAHEATLESGDGTVPLFSTNLYNPIRSFDDRGAGHDMYWCAVSHLGLAQSTAVWAASVAYLEGAADYSTDALGAQCPDGSYGSASDLVPSAPGGTGINCVLGAVGHNAAITINGNGAPNECRRLLGAGEAMTGWALSGAASGGNTICQLSSGRGFTYVVTDTGGAYYGQQACAQLQQPGGI